MNLSDPSSRWSMASVTTSVLAYLSQRLPFPELVATLDGLGVDMPNPGRIVGQVGAVCTTIALVTAALVSAYKSISAARLETQTKYLESLPGKLAADLASLKRELADQRAAFVAEQAESARLRGEVARLTELLRLATDQLRAATDELNAFREARRDEESEK